jgi:hypothetical protein
MMDVNSKLQEIENLLNKIQINYTNSMSESEEILFHLATIRIEIDPGIIYRFVRNFDKKDLLIDLKKCKNHLDNSLKEDKLRSKNKEIIRLYKDIDLLIQYMILKSIP